MAIENDNLELVRVNIFMPNEVKEWYQEKAKKYGTSMSSYMAIGLREHMEQKKMVDLMQNPDFMELAKKAMAKE